MVSDNFILVKCSTSFSTWYKTDKLGQLWKKTKHHDLDSKYAAKIWPQGAATGKWEFSGNPLVTEACPQKKPWGPNIFLFLGFLSTKQAALFCHAIAPVATWHLHHMPRSTGST